MLGNDHPSTATTYNNLAEVYSAQGDYARALEYYRKSYLVLYFRLGAEHPNAITVKRNLAAAFDQANISPETFDVWLEEKLEQHSSSAGGLTGDT